MKTFKEYLAEKRSVLSWDSGNAENRQRPILSWDSGHAEQRDSVLDEEVTANSNVDARGGDCKNGQPQNPQTPWITDRVTM
mgnify:CR=1 FL=1